MTDVVTIGDIVLRATSTDDSGAWNAPEKTAEQGFPYSSYAGSEPIEGSIEAWVPKTQYPELQSLRESGEPFPASIGHISLEQAKLDGLDTQNEGRVMWDSEQETTVPAYQVSVTIKQIRESEIETAEISIETESGSMGSAASESERSYAQPEDEDGGDAEDETGGIAGSLSGVRESLSGVL